jgi:hypothetical protein
MEGLTNVFPEDLYSGEHRTGQIPGLTQKELFAAIALGAMLNRPDADHRASRLAENAVLYAEVLITALEVSQAGVEREHH